VKIKPRSLSLRLLILFVVSSIVILLVLSQLFSHGLSTEWRASVRPHLAQYVYYVQEDLGNPPSSERADELAASLPVDLHIYERDAIIHSTKDALFDPSSFRFTELKQDRFKRRGNDPKESTKHYDRLQFSQSRHHAVVKIPMNEYSVYVELDRSSGRSAAHRIHLYSLPIALAALLTLLYFLLRRLLSPIGDIKSGVAKMTAGDLDHRIPVTGQDDLSQLGQSVNGLSERIQKLLDAKRELLLSVSHELRSPITRAHLATEMMPDGDNRERILDELRLLDSLIESLIESERLQSEHAVLNLRTLEFKELAQTCAADIRAEYGDEIGELTVQVPAALDTQIQGDDVRLMLLCRNLLSNAVQHGKSAVDQTKPNQAFITMTIEATDSLVIFHVTDQGVGVEQHELEALTDAFYRPDPSRAHGKGGVGLGLSLARLIAEAHGGSLTLSCGSGTEPGLTARVQLSRG